MSFNDTVDGMTGRQIKGVQTLTGESIQKSTDMIMLIFAVGYVLQETGEVTQDGFNSYLDSTTYKTAAVATGAEETVPDPNAEPVSS
ncbi:hypothetical protein [Rhodococcus sp. SORGH_AS_0303]|uniref:hypothetical protein n=1 Tax=Rhodococcus sp. SORGH_AS_0303 TaxID=3041753 RepID=UPI0027883CF0|nr:hypothetical protein [Rhodococcus sp. SORGH_AS_0303]MDQ1202847.1 hypothetical protein [Rhodococcus sp. SORGH_AS_0303]